MSSAALGTAVRTVLLCLMLPQSGFGVETADRRWETAIESNRIDVLEELVAVVGDVDRSTATGKTALMAAASRGATTLAQRLLESGAAIDAKNRGSGTALTYAAWSGHEPTLRLLLDHGAEVNWQSSNGWTALMMGAAKDHPGAVAALLAAGASSELADVYAWTPLMRAAYEGHFEVVEILLAAPDRNVELRNDQGQTALHLAVIGKRPATVALLLREGAAPNPVDNHGRTPTEIAAMSEQQEIGEILLEAIAAQPQSQH